MRFIDLALIIGFLLLVAFIVSLPIAKLEVCRTYYSEISWYSCLVSNYGLPARGGK